ncbi:MAG: hypothetical protein ACYCSO_07555 [Cuniculiplasma sp.]
MNVLDDLDWKIRISVDLESDLTAASKEFKITSEMGLYMKENGCDLTLFFKDSPHMERDMAIFLNKNKAKLKDNIWRIRSELDQPYGFIKILKDLINVPSAVLMFSWLENGFFNFDLIFSRKELDKISEIVMEGMLEAEEVKIKYLGPSGGYLEALKSIGKKNMISVAELVIDPFSRREFSDSQRFGENLIRIIKNPYEGEFFHSIFFKQGENDEVRPELNEIKKGMMYEGKTQDLLFSEFSSALTNAGIPVVMRISSFHDSRFYFFVGFPFIFTMEILDIFRKSSLNDIALRPVLKRIQPMGEWIGEMGENSDLFKITNENKTDVTE